MKKMKILLSRFNAIIRIPGLRNSKFFGRKTADLKTPEALKN